MHGEEQNLEFMKSQKGRMFSVIPAKAGIQGFAMIMNSLDSDFHRSDDFLRDLIVLCELCGKYLE